MLAVYNLHNDLEGMEHRMYKSRVMAKVSLTLTVFFIGANLFNQSHNDFFTRLLVYKTVLGPMVRHYALLYGFHNDFLPT